MLAGNPVEGCKSCYQDESNGLTSMRQDSLKKLVPVENKVPPIEQLEVSFSNLCNLACVHCSNFFSTKWYSEDVKAGRLEKSGVLNNDFNFNKWDLSNIREIKIIGGEPFMEQDKFIKFLSNINLSNITLQICTNGTILPNQQLKLLIEKCKKVYLCVSMDGLGTTNDWYRWPGKFETVIDNIKRYEEWWADNKQIVPIIHHVINVINILELKDFVDYMKTNFPRWTVEWDWIRWPYWQQLSSLPEDFKNNLIEEFKQLSKDYYSEHNRIPNPYEVSISRLQENTTVDWGTVIDQIKKISLERNLDFLEMVPKYSKLWIHSNV
jgi:sulfatase maturation enzyme AslB (radical SAM superfamily)